MFSLIVSDSIFKHYLLLLLVPFFLVFTVTLQHDWEYIEDKTSVYCNTQQIKCNADETCISKIRLCDGVFDCSDGQDEFQSKCNKLQCNDEEYRCHYGGCVHWFVECNGIRDCPDGTDELDCEDKENSNDLCRGGEFECISGECIHRTLRCNGIKNCEDGSDETITICKNNRCFPGLFRCDYGGCIDDSLKCNGYPDCLDGSDEHSILCGEEYGNPKNQTDQIVPDELIIDPSIKKYPKSWCLIPVPPKNGNYYLERTDNGDQFPEAGEYTPFALTYTCDPDYRMSVTPHDGFVRCKDGQWINKLPVPECLETCQPPSSATVVFKCNLNDITLDCRDRLPVGTYVDMKCKDFHKEKYYLPVYNTSCITVEGSHRSQWTEGTLECEAECGIIPYGIPTIIGGENTTIEHAPWHVGLYKRSNGTHLYQCGGSLINPLTVLTAAHCVTDPNSGIKADVSLYDIAIGITNSNLTKEKDALLIPVDQIEIPVDYKGKTGHYEHDIALLKLREEIQLTRKSLLVCVDWDYSNWKEKNKDEGFVVGWGLTGKVNDTILKRIKLNVLDRTECNQQANEEFKSYIRSDKFCAEGPKDGHIVSSGDSGGGFIVTSSREENANRYFIRGITSVKQTSNDRFAAFTRVSDYLKFLEKAKEWYTKTIRSD